MILTLLQIKFNSARYNFINGIYSLIFISKYGILFPRNHQKQLNQHPSHRGYALSKYSLTHIFCG